MNIKLSSVIKRNHVSTFAIIETLHIVVLTNVIQSTGCRHDKFSNRYWFRKKEEEREESFLLFELGGSGCIYSPMFHNCSGLPVKLAMLKAVDLSLLQLIILIQLCILCLIIKLLCWVMKGKLKQDLYNKTFVFYSQISSGLTLEPCTVLCRTVVSVSFWDESQPLLDQFAFCEA